MSVLDQARLLIFRCHQKGLEVLLINNEFQTDDLQWKIPEGHVYVDNHAQRIELESLRDKQGNPIKIIALEADWHQIPSIRSLLKHDVKRLGNKVKKTIEPSMEFGHYVNIKQAVKLVLPSEYQALKELKDIVLDRNSLEAI